MPKLHKMTTTQIVEQIRKKKSFLCIGLDVDLDKIPSHLLKSDDPIFEFNKAIIDATHSYCVSYKPNTAFYEAYGAEGFIALEKTITYLNQNYPEIFTIADAKRGDIGNTSAMYARGFLQNLNFDAITVAPYMGRDSVEPFLAVPNKHTILLALTSNNGAFDFETLISDTKPFYQHVIEKSTTWQHAENLMYVVGATKAAYLEEIRKIVPNSFLLVPGVGAQGGSLQDVCHHGLNDQVGLLVNSSRAILYASDKTDFAKAAAKEAKKIQKEMHQILKNYIKK